MVFLLGIANFALAGAVVDSGHPLLERLPRLFRRSGRRVTLIMEFAVLLAAMLLVANGWPLLLWAYLAYSALNAIAAWLILSDRV